MIQLHYNNIMDLLNFQGVNQDNIKTQIITDLGVYEKDSGEYEYIKEFYNKWKTLFNFRIEDLEI